MDRQSIQRPPHDCGFIWVMPGHRTHRTQSHYFPLVAFSLWCYSDLSCSLILRSISCAEGSIVCIHSPSQVIVVQGPDVFWLLFISTGLPVLNDGSLTGTCDLWKPHRTNKQCGIRRPQDPFFIQESFMLQVARGSFLLWTPRRQQFGPDRKTAMKVWNWFLTWRKLEVRGMLTDTQSE